MGREPFQGSDWGVRGDGDDAGESPPRERRLRGQGRRLLGGAAIAAVLVGGGVAASLASGFSLGSELRPLQRSGLAAAAEDLRAAERARVKRTLHAPHVLGVRRTKLESIADCESHGDPRARSGDGTYRGKYQFDRGTWRSLGGRGDPAKAPELEQDQRAAALYKRAGSSPWPACG